MMRILVVLAFSVFLDAQTMRIMSFNVRYPAKGDGENVWENRKDLLVDTVRKHSPDVMGTQELFHEQGEYIVAKLPHLAWFGLSRRGNKEDEHMGVFYRKDVLELLSSGNFWLSETPEVPGSMSWNVSLPRMVTWGEFRHRKSGRRFRFYNTHFAHRGEDGEARIQSARMISEHLRKSPSQEDIILTGDFNTDAATEPYNILTTVLSDTHARAGTISGPTGTFHGFTGKARPDRIDWILYRGKLRPVSVEAITDHLNGRYPSDHFPVLAIFELTK